MSYDYDQVLRQNNNGNESQNLNQKHMFPEVFNASVCGPREVVIWRHVFSNKRRAFDGDWREVQYIIAIKKVNQDWKD